MATKILNEIVELYEWLELNKEISQDYGDGTHHNKKSSSHKPPIIRFGEEKSRIKLYRETLGREKNKMNTSVPSTYMGHNMNF